MGPIREAGAATTIRHGILGLAIFLWLSSGAPPVVEAQTVCNSADSTALLAFKADLLDTVGLFTTWVAGTDCCTWHGVNCTVAGRVQGVTLSGGRNPNADDPDPNRSSTLPVGSSIGSLSQLNYFFSSAVHFNGPVPPSWVGLTKLQSLNVYQSSFTGGIPTFLGGLTLLTQLVLVGDSGALTGSIPPEICNLRQLTLLSFAGNLLSGSLPLCLGTLARLEQLTLSNNSFSGPVPRWIGNLQALSILDLSVNRFSGFLPPTISRATQLTYLELAYNFIGGRVPATIGNLQKLSFISVSNNFLTGNLPSTLGNLQSISFMDFSVNNLTGPIPASLGSLPNLVTLFLSHNLFTGPFPSQLGNIPRQIYVDVSYNSLSGQLPSTLSNFGFFLGNNNAFSGAFPLSLATSTFRVDLSYNRLRSVQQLGSLPSNPQLVQLSLAFNELTGGIPSWLTSLTNVNVLDISSNQLTGAVSIPLLTMPNMQYLNVSNNPLGSQLPTSSFTSNVDTLDLHNDQLHGPVPATFVSSFPNIRFLDLSVNPGLTGTVPHVP